MGNQELEAERFNDNNTGQGEGEHELGSKQGRRFVFILYFPLQERIGMSPTTAHGEDRFSVLYYVYVLK